MQHDVLFWAHFVTNWIGVAVYVSAILIFRRFARRSLYRPTCIALCWVFGVLTCLLTGHTVAAVWAPLRTWLDLIDIGTRLVIASAVGSIYLDTRRRPFDGARL